MKRTIIKKQRNRKKLMDRVKYYNKFHFDIKLFPPQLDDFFNNSAPIYIYYQEYQPSGTCNSYWGCQSQSERAYEKHLLNKLTKSKPFKEPSKIFGMYINACRNSHRTRLYFVLEEMLYGVNSNMYKKALEEFKTSLEKCVRL